MKALDGFGQFFRCQAFGFALDKVQGMEAFCLPHLFVATQIQVRALAFTFHFQTCSRHAEGRKLFQRFVDLPGSRPREVIPSLYVYPAVGLLSRTSSMKFGQSDLSSFSIASTSGHFLTLMVPVMLYEHPILFLSLIVPSIALPLFALIEELASGAVKAGRRNEVLPAQAADIRINASKQPGPLRLLHRRQ